MSASIHRFRREPAAAPSPLPLSHKGRGESPPMNVAAYTHAILEAANSLMRNDYRIVAFFCRYEPQQLMIELQDSAALRALARVGVASYDDQGHDELGPYRTGFFTRGVVTAFWRERGGA